MNKKIIIISGFLLSLVAMILGSCATTEGLYRSDSLSSTKGVWHRIEEGQTLWRIAKTYRVPLEILKDANDINDVVHIATGTWIYIPDADRVLYVQGNTHGLPQNEGKRDFSWPVKGEVVKNFGKDQKDFNYGIDLMTRTKENIIATQRGVVVLSNKIRGHGNTIIIEHEDDFFSVYSKNIRSIVQEGQKVERNTIIARVEPENGSDKALIHYELFYKGKPVNPLYYLP